MQSLDDIKLYAAKNSIPIMRDGGIEFICNYIKEHKIKKILEIGTAIGFSAIEFAQVAPDITVTTIELDIDRHIKAKQNIHDSGLDGRINAIHGDALKLELRDRQNQAQLFDMIFIDAAKGQYINFFQKYCLAELKKKLFPKIQGKSCSGWSLYKRQSFFSWHGRRSYPYP